MRNQLTRIYERYPRAVLIVWLVANVIALAGAALR